MIVSITESCHMGCTHCMDDAKPCDRHMSFRVFRDAIGAFNDFGGIELIITGGEPTENPDWVDFLDYALKTAHGSSGTGFAHITLTTNGMNISKDRDIQSLLTTYLDRYHNRFTVQVTHVPEYYPNHVDLSSAFFKLESVAVCTEIEAMYPMGRAKQNNLPCYPSRCSKCFNIRSAVHHLGSLRDACMLLNLKGKFCTPQIDIYGNIKLGESTLCPVATNIYSSNDKIVEDICNFKCSGCDIINRNLPENYLKAIGEC